MTETGGRLFVVGIGPGKLEEMTLRAEQALKACEVVVGYSLYTDMIAPIVDEKVIISSGMGREKERCEGALQEALLGRKVALVSSGDSGIYGMAGLVLELHRRGVDPRAIRHRVFPSSGHWKDSAMKAICAGEFSRDCFVRACIQNA